MGVKEGQWMFNSTDDGIWGSSDYFDTKEDAIEAGKEYYAHDEKSYDAFYVGQIFPCTPYLSVDASRILEDISLNVYEEIGEVAEDYLMDVKPEHEQILEERLNKVLKEWLKEFEYEPSFFKIDNIEKIVVE